MSRVAFFLFFSESHLLKEFHCGLCGGCVAPGCDVVTVRIINNPPITRG